MALSQLPTELVWQISDFLKPEDWASLSLTSKWLASLLLPRARVVTLAVAVGSGDKERFFRTLKSDVDLNCPCANGTVLEGVIGHHADEYILPLLERGASRVPPPGSMCWKNGYTLLHFAAERGSEAAVRQLLDYGQGMDPFIADEYGVTPLMCAVFAGNAETACLLMQIYREKGVEIDPEHSSHPLLIGATELCLMEMIVVLIKTGSVRINARNGNDETPLHLVCGYGLADIDIDPEAEDFNIERFAIDTQAFEKATVHALADAGADFSVTATEHELTPLHYMSRYSLGHLLPHLLDRGADLAARCVKGGTSLHWAARGGDEVTIGLLIDAGLSVDDTDQHNRTPLLWAYHGELDEKDDLEEQPFVPEDPSVDAIVLLIEHGSEVAHRDDKLQNILHCAAEHNRYEAVEYLLLHCSMDIDSQDINGCTALHLAAMANSRESTIHLLRNGPNLELQNVAGQTALDIAYAPGNERVANVIMECIKGGFEVLAGPSAPSGMS